MVIHDNLVKVYWKAAYSYLTLAIRAASFKAEESNLEGKSGRSKTEMIKSNIDLVGILMVKNPRISYSYLEEETSLSRVTLNRIINDKPELTKRSSRWDCPMN